jgi:hypothetical protein
VKCQMMAVDGGRRGERVRVVHPDLSGHWSQIGVLWKIPRIVGSDSQVVVAAGARWRLVDRRDGG